MIGNDPKITLPKVLVMPARPKMDTDKSSVALFYTWTRKNLSCHDGLIGKWQFRPWFDPE
jgi:hypothetical protein